MMLEMPLLHRTTRKVLLTRRGIALKGHCEEILSRIDEIVGYVGNLDNELEAVVRQVHSVKVAAPMKH